MYPGLKDSHSTSKLNGDNAREGAASLKSPKPLLRANVISVETVRLAWLILSHGQTRPQKIHGRLSASGTYEDGMYLRSVYVTSYDVFCSSCPFRLTFKHSAR